MSGSGWHRSADQTCQMSAASPNYLMLRVTPMSAARLKAVKNRHPDALQTEVTIPSEAVWTMLRTQRFELSSTNSKAAPMVTAKELMRNTAFRISAFLASLFPVWLRTRKNETKPPVATSKAPREVARDVRIKLENDAKNLKNQKIATRKLKITTNQITS